jgi:hypothetical protein
MLSRRVEESPQPEGCSEGFDSEGILVERERAAARCFERARHVRGNRRTYGECGILRPMALRACTVSFLGSGGVRHSVDVSAESLYEAAAAGLNLLRQEGWSEVVGPGTQVEVEVQAPAARHSLTLAQIRRWCDGVAASPEEVLKRARVKRLLSEESAKRRT